MTTQISKIKYSGWSFLITMILLAILGIVILEKTIADESFPKLISYIPHIPAHSLT